MAIYMILAAAAFAVMGGFVKTLGRLPAWETVFFRALINVVLMAPWVAAAPPVAWRKEFDALMLRGISGGLAVWLYFFAITHMKLADAVMLNNASPVIVLILSALFLGERLPKGGLVFVLLAFSGVALILKPDFNEATPAERLGGLAGIAGAFASAVAYVSIKVATRSIPSRFIVLWFALVTCALSAVPMALAYVSPTPFEWLMLLGCGLSASLAQVLMTKGYARLPASVASPMLFLTVVFAAVIGWAIWGEIPDGWSIFGGALVFAGLIGGYAGYRRPRPPIA
jgi:drug/metabolite transporter (DMT)-like permease